MRTPAELNAPPAASVARYEVGVVGPFRLDLTVSALRRLPTNLVDVLTPDMQYMRALAGPPSPVTVRVAQEHSNSLAVTIAGNPPLHPHALALVRRMLGVDRDLRRFRRASARIQWLQRLAKRLSGLKPPRYPTLWEAFVNAIAFQQVSLQAASAVVRRMILELESPVDNNGVLLYPFPNAATVLAAHDRVLRGVGLSAGKVATLRRAGEALESKTLTEQMLEERSSSDAVVLLRQIKGVGPWTATLILLRGMGRLDVFPMNDSGVARNLALVTGAAPSDVSQLLETLGEQRGMLYYSLLLARLDARGEVGLPSVPPG